MNEPDKRMVAVPAIRAGSSQILFGFDDGPDTPMTDAIFMNLRDAVNLSNHVLAVCQNFPWDEAIDFDAEDTDDTQTELPFDNK